jgi:hypothetical protein
LSDQSRKEFIRYMARHLKLQLDADELATLEEAVEGNEEYLVAVDATTRTPAEDPLAFMRFVHALETSDER